MWTESIRPVSNSRRASSAEGRGPMACSGAVKRSWPIPVRLRLASRRTTPGREVGFSTTATGWPMAGRLVAPGAHGLGLVVGRAGQLAAAHPGHDDPHDDGEGHRDDGQRGVDDLEPDRLVVAC